MEKQIGTILKLKKKNAIVMTRDCRIISVKTQPGMYVGLEINFGKNEVIYPRNKKTVCSGIAAGITVLFLIMFTLLNLTNENRIFAYVDIDFNKSLELAVDKDSKVLKVYSFDDETQDLINELDLKSKSVDTAIKEVVSKANKNENMILISACLKNTDNLVLDNDNEKEYEEFKKLLETCKNAVEEHGNRTIESKVVAINYKYKELANDKEISMGRCFLYEKAKQQGVDINMEEIKTKSISETLKKVKIEDTSIIHGNEKDLSLSKPEDNNLHAADPNKLTDNPRPICSAAPENKLLEPHEGEQSMLPLPQEYIGKPDDLNPSHQIKPKSETSELKENPNKPISGNRTTPSAPIEPKKVEAAPLPTSIAIKDKQLPPPHTPDEPKRDGVNPPPTSDAIKNKPESLPPTPVEPKRDKVNPPPTPITTKNGLVPPPPTPVEHKKSEINPPPTPAARKNEPVPPPPPIPAVTKNGPVPPPPTPNRR